MNQKNFKIKELIELSSKEIQKKNFKEAKGILKDIILINPNIPKIHNNLGIINLNLGDFLESVENFKKVKNLDPKFISSYCNLGLAYSKIGKEKLAIKNYLEAIDIDPKNYVANYNLGSLYKKKNQIKNAEQYLNIAIDLKPKMTQAYNNLFEIYDKSNQLEKFKELLFKAKLNINNDTILDFFSGIYEFKKKNYLNTIKIFKKINLNDLDLKRIIVKNEIVAKSYDFIGNYEKAFNNFECANNSLKLFYNQKFDKEVYLNFLKKRINYFSKKNLEKWSDKKFVTKNNDPIFLIGFPRSGTTLLDTILRSHPSIEVLEEEPIIDEMINELEKEINNDFSKLENLNGKLFNKIRNVYFSKRNKYLDYNKNKIYIDKLPLNIVNVAEIFRFFPNAKFIFALRNPYDVVLSCFMQIFSPNHAMSNFLNLNDTVRLYDMVMDLWISYSNNLNIKFQTIKYESVIQDFDKTIGNLLKFLELDWSDDVRNYTLTARNRGIINTPSYNQVNLPLYNKSINRWKNYEDKFLEFEEILNKWTIRFNY